LDLGPPLLIMVSFINFAHVLFFGNGAFYNRLFMALDPLYLRRERERERERERFFTITVVVVIITAIHQKKLLLLLLLLNTLQ
jgi:hypothetical protein